MIAGGAMRRLVLLFFFMFTFVLACLAQAAQVDGAKAAAGDDAKVGKEKPPRRGGPHDKNALWWDDTKIVKALSLTAEQRDKMAKIRDAYLKNAPQDRRPDAFHEALVQGKWNAARAESKRVAAVAEQAVALRGALKIDTLAVLDKKQLGLIVDKYPRLIYQPWRRAMGGAKAR
jgi:Spy/CpxP family protein refolding chaperone